MKATWDGFVLADETPGKGMSGFTLNGQQIIQEQTFIRAAESKFFGRKNRSLRIGFSVTHTFNSIADAEQFALTHYATLSDGPATLVLRCGTESEATSDVYVLEAVLEGVSVPKYSGAAVTFGYRFAGSKINAVITVEEDDMPSRTVDIPNGVDTFDVEDQAFPSTPVRVMPHVRIPADGDNLIAHVVDGTITTDGFTIQLSGVVPAVGYKLDFQYQL